MELEKERKTRRVEVKHDYENRVIFANTIHVSITEEDRKLKGKN